MLLLWIMMMMVLVLVMMMLGMWLWWVKRRRRNVRYNRISGKSVLRTRMSRQIIGRVFHAARQLAKCRVAQSPGSTGADTAVRHGVKPADGLFGELHKSIFVLGNVDAAKG